MKISNPLQKYATTYYKDFSENMMHIFVNVGMKKGNCILTNKCLICQKYTCEQTEKHGCDIS